MKNYCVYDIATGVITQIGSCNEDMVEFQVLGKPQSGAVLLPSYGWDYWIDIDTTPHTAQNKTNQALSTNKTTITADGIDECLITGIANPSTVIWHDGQQDEITDGELGFSIDQAGTYKIKIISRKHFTEEISIEAII